MARTTALPVSPITILAGISSIDLLEELRRRGGQPGVVADALMLCIEKSMDYNSEQADLDPHNIDRESYFPFGAVSYAQMLHTKAMRFVSITHKLAAGGEPNFEGLRDTAKDIINYAGFFLADERLK